MKGDFSRLTFPWILGQRSVAMQQGRVLLDSDWNTAMEIERRVLETLARDVIGEAGGPKNGAGFALEPLYSLLFESGTDQFIEIPKSPSLPLFSQEFTLQMAVIPNLEGPIFSYSAPRTGFAISVGLQPTVSSKVGSPDAGSTIPIVGDTWSLVFEQSDGTKVEHQLKARNTPLRLAVVGTKDQRTFVIDGQAVGVLSTPSPPAVGWLPMLEAPPLYVGAGFGPMFADQAAPGRTESGATRQVRSANTSSPHAGRDARLSGPPASKPQRDDSDITPILPSEFLTGRLESLNIWNIALGFDALADETGIRITQIPPNLVCHYLFSPKSVAPGGKTVKDLSGQGNDGALAAPAQLGQRSFWILPGRYYVAGRVCENPDTVAFSSQPFYPIERDPLQANGSYSVYLEVWERFVSPIQYSAIREVALGGADTTGRIQSVWQVRVGPAKEPPGGVPTTGTLAARRIDPLVSTVGNDLYRIEIHHAGYAQAPSFRPELLQLGGEVQSLKYLDTSSTKVLLEVVLADAEQASRFQPSQTVHLVGPAAEGLSSRQAYFQTGVVEASAAGTVEIRGVDPLIPLPIGSLRLLPIASYKWSRDNGDLAFPISTIQPTITSQGEEAGLVTLLGPGYNGLDIAPGDWLEQGNERTDLLSQPGPFFQIDSFDPTDLELVLKGWTPALSPSLDPNLSPLLRRWDVTRNSAGSQAGTPVQPVSPESWNTLENGIQIRFAATEPAISAYFASGDYWTIPVRDVETSSVEWPGGPRHPASLPPQGIQRIYAEIATAATDANGDLSLTDERVLFAPLAGSSPQERSKA